MREGTSAAGRVAAGIVLVASSIVLASCSDDLQKTGGSARTLEGRVAVVSVFVSQPGNRWTCAEKEAMMAVQRRAERWLVAEARQRNTDLEFRTLWFGVAKDVTVEKISPRPGHAGADPRWASVALAGLGLSDPEDFRKWVRKQASTDNVALVVHLKQSGLSFAQTCNACTGASAFFVESAVIYRNYPSGRKSGPTVIAHELLHLFGAWDLYENPRQPAEKASLAKRLFPTEIMLCTANQLDRSEISDLTAYLVGWKVPKASWYAWFKPESGRAAAILGR